MFLPDSRTPGMLVHLFGVTQVQVGGRKAKDSPGGKGVWCVSKVIWKVLQLKVILTRNLNLMKKIDECSFCSFRSFDNELRSKVRITMK